MFGYVWCFDFVDIIGMFGYMDGKCYLCVVVVVFFGVLFGVVVVLVGIVIGGIVIFGVKLGWCWFVFDELMFSIGKLEFFLKLFVVDFMKICCELIMVVMEI